MRLGEWRGGGGGDEATEIASAQSGARDFCALAQRPSRAGLARVFRRAGGGQQGDRLESSVGRGFLVRRLADCRAQLAEKSRCSSAQASPAGGARYDADDAVVGRQRTRHGTSSTILRYCRRRGSLRARPISGSLCISPTQPETAPSRGCTCPESGSKLTANHQHGGVEGGHRRAVCWPCGRRNAAGSQAGGTKKKSTCCSFRGAATL